MSLLFLPTSSRVFWRPLTCCDPRRTHRGCSLLFDERSIKKPNPKESTNCARRWELPRSGNGEAVFHLEFRQDLRYWFETDRKVALRAFELIEQILRDPLTTIGKPEPLKYLLAGCWSRRLTQEHRLVYRVRGQRIDFMQARYHY